jgi:hypothetical protein
VFVLAIVTSASGHFVVCTIGKYALRAREELRETPQNRKHRKPGAAG